MAISNGTQLGGRYEIRGALGSGGMGDVYRAFDRSLEREVAVKVLSELLQCDRLALNRFDGEAKALAAVSHPNILAVFDVGTDSDIAFVVTELLEGESLQSRLDRSAILWRETVDIALAVAEGLQAAHAHSVVHGDLKPDNVFITRDGPVKIVDFGLARFVPVTAFRESESQAPTEMISHTTLAGTLTYLSPEQVRGTPGDVRSDVFAFGCMLYAMLTGAAPFRGGSVPELMAAILRDAPPELDRKRGIPSSLEQLIHRCLQKDPDDRVQTARELHVALGSIAEAKTDSPVTNHGPDSAELSQPIDSLAILPFLGTNTNPEVEQLCDGLIGRLIDSLSRIESLRVMALTTVFRYKGREMDPRTVGQELNVRAVFTARIVAPGDTPTIEAELVDARDGARLWGHRYSCDVCDLLELQDELASRISKELKAELHQTDGEQLRTRATRNSEAYRLYLRGRYYWNKRSRDGLLRSVEQFELSLQEDPGFSLAHAGLADAYSFLGGFGYLPPREAYTKAKIEAKRALELDPTLAEAHCSLATVDYRFDWNWERAEQGFLLALHHNPGYATAHHWFGVYLVLMGRFEEGLASVERALVLDPLSLVNWTRGYVLYYMRRFDDAIEQLKQALTIDPTFARAYVDVGLCLIQKGAYAQGIEEIQKGVDLLEPNPELLVSLGYAYGVAGNDVEGRRIQDELHELSKRRFVSQFSMGVVCVGLGDLEEAFQWLEKSLEKREDAMVSLLVNPRLDRLRPDPRFGELLRRIGLPGDWTRTL